MMESEFGSVGTASVMLSGVDGQKAKELSSGIASLEEFLDEISLVSDVEEHKNDTDVVTLMTIHSAKGLEFDSVFLVGMEEGIFPHNNSCSCMVSS